MHLLIFYILSVHVQAGQIYKLVAVFGMYLSKYTKYERQMQIRASGKS